MKIKLFLTTLIILVLTGGLVKIYAQDRATDIESAKMYYQKAGFFAGNYQPDSAAAYFGKSAEIFKKYSIWKNYYVAKNEMIVWLMQADRLKEAEVISNNLLDSVSVCFEAENEYVANVNFSQGRLLFVMRKLHDALYYYQEALRIRKEIGKTNDLKNIDLLNEIGNTYNELSDYSMALDYYRQVLTERQKITGPDDPDMAPVYNNIGIVYQSQGDFENAIEYKMKAVDIRKEAYGEENPEVAAYYSGLGAVYMDKGEMEYALEYYLRAIEIKMAIHGEKHLSIAEDYNSLGNLYEKRMEYTKALDYQVKAIDIQIAILGDMHPLLAKTYDFAGRIYKSMGDFKSAEKSYSKAILIQQKFYGNMHPDLASFYNNLGNVFSLQKNHAEALKNYQKALNIFQEFYGGAHPANIKPNLNIANEYYKMGEYEKALRFYQRSLIINVRTFNSEETDFQKNPVIKGYNDQSSLLAALQGKAETFAGMFKKTNDRKFLDLSLENYTKCDTIIVKLRRALNKQEDKYYISLLATKIYGGAIDVSLKLFDMFGENMEYRKKAFMFAEKNKQGTLLDALSGINAKRFAGLPEEILEQDKTLNEQIAFYEKQMADSYDDNVIAYYRTELFKLQEKQNKLMTQMESDYPEYYQMKYANNDVDISQLQTIIKENEMIRSYFLGDSLLTIFDIYTDSLDIQIIPVVNSFDYKVKKFRSLLLSNDPDDIEKYLKIAYEFYNMLFPGKINPKIKKIVLIPDGKLGTFPMDALITQNHTETTQMNLIPYLIKKYEFVYSYSAQLLYYTHNLAKQNNKFQYEWIGLAPVFKSDEADGITLPNGWFVSTLPASIQEIDSIYSFFTTKGHHAQKELNDQATETFVKNTDWTQYRIVHIATHGIVNSDYPELSSILMAPVNDGENDDILYSGEIYNLHMNSDLVVLSACETGLGKLMKGEGIIGLNRAFLYAGARNMILSLWKVADIPTANLMQYFYQNLLSQSQNLSTANYSSALHDAKLRLVNDPALAHPYFWSPFILIGD